MEITGVVLVYYNIVNNNHKQNSRVLYTFVPNKSFGQLLDIRFLRTFNSEFPYIDVWFTGQNSKPLEVDDKTNKT